MKAAIYTSYGSPEVLKLTQVSKPEPKDHELLIKAYATTVTSGDVRLRSSRFPPLFWLPARLIFGLFKPKKQILGHEFAGVVEKVGSDVSKFSEGDEVFGTTTMLATGSYAEYVCAPQAWKSGAIALKPNNLSFEEAATLPIGGMTALFLLEKAGLSESHNKRKKVLIYGASGSVGTYAVQLAKQWGSEVTGVCSGKNEKMIQNLGADHAINYKHEDYTTLPKTYDIVFDAVGKTSKKKARNILKKGGRFVSVNMFTKEEEKSLLLLKGLAEKGSLKPYIDRSYTLENIQEAHTYVDQGHKKGNVVIQILSK